MKKILIITGANGYLGKFAAHYFIKKKYDFYYFISRREISVEAQAKNLKNILCDDLSSDKNVKDAFSQIIYEKDDVVFLLDTVGGFKAGHLLWEYEIDEIKKMFDLNFITTFLTAKYFSKIVEKTKGGSICFISAKTGIHPQESKFAYGLSKNAINYLVKSLAIEGKKINLTANSIAPFAIDNESNREWIDDIQKLNSPESICDIVFNCFENYPKISGEIFEP